RRSAAEAMKLLPSVQDPAEWSRLASTVLNGPCDPATAGQLAQRMGPDHAGVKNAVLMHLPGCVLFRTGRHLEAHEACQHSARRHGLDGFVATWLYQAMTAARLGQKDIARRHLSRAEHWYREKTLLNPPPSFATWQQQAFWYGLLEEAREAVSGPPTMPRLTRGE